MKQIPYPSNTNQESSGHQHHNRSQEGEHKLFTKKSVKRSIRWDGTGVSILETLGQTQSAGEHGDGVGCQEFNGPVESSPPGIETKYPVEQTGGVRIEYYVEQTFLLNYNK